MPANLKSKIISVSITPKSKKVLKTIITIIRANQVRETTDLNNVNLFHPDEWAQMIEVLPKSGKHLLALKNHLRQKWLAYQMKKETAQGRLGDVFKPPPGVVGEPGTVIEHPELGVFYQNYHGDLMFQRALELQRLNNEDLFGFTKLLKPSPPAFKLHDLLMAELKRRADLIKKEEVKKGVGSTK